MPAAERLSYWHHALEHAFDGSLQSRTAATAMFDGTIRQVALGELTLSHIDSVGQHLHWAPARPGHVVLIADLRNSWQLRCGNQLHRIRPSDVAAFRSGLGCELDFPHGISAVAIEASAASGRRWGALVDGPAACRVVPRDRGWGRILSTACMEFGQEPELALHMPAGDLARLLESALAAVLAPACVREPPGDLLEEARRLCAERIDDPALGPRQVAALLGVSPRTLERTFARANSTFGETLRAMRMERAALLLQQAASAHLSVAEIGQRCGFASPSHFVREFRRRWGETPGSWRQQTRLTNEKLRRLADAERLVHQARLRIAQQKSRIESLRGDSTTLLAQAVALLRQMEETLVLFEEHREQLRLEPAPTPAPRNGG